MISKCTTGCAMVTPFVLAVPAGAGLPVTTAMARKTHRRGESGARYQAVQDPVEDRDALLSRRGRVLGPGHVERALVERADENVGERGNGLRRDGSGLDRRLQPGLHQPEKIGRASCRERV